MAIEQDEAVRLAIYEGFASDGRAPTVEQLAALVGEDALSIGGTLGRLHEARHIVLGAGGEIVMAHPFASEPLGFSVMGRETLWWGGCAWDSFAIPQVVENDPNVLVATQCPGCGKPLAWVVNRESAPLGDEVAHFLVPMAQVWDDVVHACSNQRLFCSVECVHRWAESSGLEPGYVMDLATLWRLASRWYEGRLEPGYQRREPGRARDYFRDVGLTGPFWGL